MPPRGLDRLDPDQAAGLFFPPSRMSMDTATILAGCGFFMHVRGPARQRLAEMAQVRRYERGQTIFRQGEACPGVYVLGSGLVRVYKLSPNGKEHVLHLVSPGGTFAEVAAIGRFDCPAFAEALEESTCLLLPTEPFTRALHEDHSLCLQLMASMAGWVRHLVALVEDVVLRDATGRVARYLLGVSNPDSGEVQLPALKRHLANHLNLTSETLSRTLRRLADLDLIISDEQQLTVLDRRGLEELTETG